MWSLIILIPYFCLFIYFKESPRPQQKHHLGTASSESLGLNWFNVRITPVLDSAVTHKHLLFSMCQRLPGLASILMDIRLLQILGTPGPEVIKFFRAQLS